MFHKELVIQIPEYTAPHETITKIITKQTANKISKNSYKKFT